jgi:hypothetical protein
MDSIYLKAVNSQAKKSVGCPGLLTGQGFSFRKKQAGH